MFHEDGERAISMYIPPGQYNPYKTFPVTIVMDFSPALMNDTINVL